MAFFVIRTLPKGIKVDNLVTLGDCTEELLVTNSESVAKSCVDGSKRPTVAFNEFGSEVFDNLARINAPVYRRRESTWTKAGREADALVHIGRRPVKQARQPERARKPGQNKGRFDHVKPVRSDEAPKKREIIIERV